MLQNRFTVAVDTSLFDAFADLPTAAQRKVRRWIQEFKQNPTKASINYEKIHQWRDPNLRSVRIDQDYRGVVLKPDQGNVYVLLWVDGHDRAYDWAKNKEFSIHPDTGSLQVIDVAVVEAAANVAPPPPSQPSLFKRYRERELIRLGVPQVLLPMVWALQNEAELDERRTDLPAEAYEALLYLAYGYTVEETLRDLELAAEPPKIDTSDFATAVKNPATIRR